jgi:hypothetical protein
MLVASLIFALSINVEFDALNDLDLTKASSFVYDGSDSKDFSLHFSNLS